MISRIEQDDFDRVWRQKYQENPQQVIEFPNLSTEELIGQVTLLELAKSFCLPIIPSKQGILPRRSLTQRIVTRDVLRRNTRETSNLIGQMEGSLSVALYQFFRSSSQVCRTEAESELLCGGIGFVLKAVEIECGKRALFDINAVDTKVLVRAAKKASLHAGEFIMDNRTSDVFSPFPEGQQNLNVAMNVLSYVVCRTPAERFMLETGASGTYYILEEGSEVVRGIK